MTSKYTWERRIERAQQLAEPAGPSQKIMAFYFEVLRWQQRLFKHINESSRQRRLTGSFESDHPHFLDQLSSLLDLVRQHGSEALAAQADEITSQPSAWKMLLQSYWQGDIESDSVFFARACLQPYLELLANTQTLPFDSKLTAVSGGQIEELTEARPHRLCPFCGRKPLVAFLSTDTSMPGILEGSAEGGRRFLMCGDCSTIWPYRRIACVNCEEESPYKLPYYVAEDMRNVRVECCDACRHYIKSIDLTQDNRAVPLVDELAATPLDLWARDQGYTKIQINLAGI